MSKHVESIKKIVSLIKNDLSRNHSNYIFFITSKCNQSCEFCFYRENINKSIDLSLAEIGLLSSKIGNISNILFSGGEPVLRKDFLEIIDVFVKNNHIKSLTIPSNGMSKDLICNLACQILSKYPMLTLQVCISLDGPEKLHDKIRGVAGAYKKAIESIKALEILSRQYERLSFNINTVLNNKNIPLIRKIIQDINHLDIQYYTHSFEIVRPESINKKIVLDNIDELKQAYNIILQYKDELYLKNLKCNFFKKLLLGALHYANIYTLYKIQFDYCASGKKWPMRCCAGFDNNVIYNNGDVSICELRKPIANIKDIINVEKLNDVFENEYEKTKNCYCTHLCYILLSMYKSKKILLFHMPLRAVKYFFIKLGLTAYF